MIINECKLCLAIDNSKSKNRLIENTPLLETKNFLILPGIGPLIEGHVLIVSKDHYTSLASMPVETIVEFAGIVTDLVDKNGDNCLFTEHGTFNEQKGGACIEHTHIHVIPTFGGEYSLLDGILPVIHEILTLDELVTISNILSPYILNINSSYQFRLYSAYNVHSQMMRKAICRKYERVDFDWSKNPKINVTKQTILKW